MIQTLAKNSLLIFTNIIVASATIYCFSNQQAGKQPVSSFIFPNQVPLSFWNQREKKNLSIEELNINFGKQPNAIISGKRYQYVRDNLIIDADIFYVVNTRGNVSKLIETQTQISEDALNQQKIKKSDDIGFYSIFRDDKFVYLSSCLNPQGKSTVTSKQFSENLNQVRLIPSLLGKWLVGKASIRDRRCLWIHLCLPLNSEINNTEEILESVWLDLAQWWTPNFPQL